MQTAFMHPPFGFSLFYLRSVAPKEPYVDRVTGAEIAPITTAQIYWGALPFVVIQVIMIALTIAFPGMVTRYKAEQVHVAPARSRSRRRSRAAARPISAAAPPTSVRARVEPADRTSAHRPQVRRNSAAAAAGSELRRQQRAELRLRRNASAPVPAASPNFGARTTGHGGRTSANEKGPRVSPEPFRLPS